LHSSSLLNKINGRVAFSNEDNLYSIAFQIKII
jgi:hypothetical protein